MRTVGALLFVVAVSFALAVGCGTDDAGGDERLSKREYLAELEAVARELQAATGASVDSNFTSPGPRELAELDDEMADRVDGLRPPQEVEDVHARLVAGLRESADELREIAVVIEDSGTLDPIDAIVKLSDVKESKALKEAAGEFQRRGYNVPAYFGGS